MNKRDVAGEILQFYPCKLIFKKCFPIINNSVRVLIYHRVIDCLNKNYEFDPGLISAFIGQFEKQVKYLKKNYDIITFKELAQLQDSGKRLPENLLLLTFDDGYYDNYKNVFPILKENNVRATIFLSTDYIDSKKMFWWDKLFYTLKKSSVNNLSIEELNIQTNRFQENKDKIIRQILQQIKKIGNDERVKVLDEIEKKTAIKIVDQVFDEDVFPLTWDNVIEMKNYGIEFGSHTLSHPILSSLSDEELKNEIYNSKKILEEKLNQKIYTISYPVGLNYSYSLKVKQYCRAAGYRYGVINEQGVNLFPFKDPFKIFRIRCERNIKINGFKSRLEFPQIFIKNVK